LMMLFAALMCYLAASPVWYHALAKMHNAFIYVRWLGIIPTALGIYGGFHELYTISVPLGGLLAAWEARFPWDGILGVPLALVLHAVLVIVERRTSSLITPENSHANPFLRLALLIGLVEVGTYKTLKQQLVASEPSEEVADTKE